MPFAEYKDFEECVGKNKDKDSPEGYCAAIHYRVTGKWPAEAQKMMKSLESKFPGVSSFLSKQR
jgi:hypothetical protein